MKKALTLTMLCTSLLSFSACDTLIYVAEGARHAYKYVAGNDVNVKEKSFAAADYLDQHIRTFIKAKHSIEAQPLYFTTPSEDNTNDLEGDLSYLARVVPYQIGTRLAELGYNVDLKPVSEMPNAGYTGEAFQSSRFILTGTMHPMEERFRIYDSVIVKINVTDRRSGKAVGSFEYNLASGRKVNDLPTTTEEINAEREKTGLQHALQ